MKSSANFNGHQIVRELTHIITRIEAAHEGYRNCESWLIDAKNTKRDFKFSAERNEAILFYESCRLRSLYYYDQERKLRSTLYLAIDIANKFLQLAPDEHFKDSVRGLLLTALILKGPKEDWPVREFEPYSRRSETEKVLTDAFNNVLGDACETRTSLVLIEEPGLSENADGKELTCFIRKLENLTAKLDKCCLLVKSNCVGEGEYIHRGKLIYQLNLVDVFRSELLNLLRQAVKAVPPEPFDGGAEFSYSYFGKVKLSDFYKARMINCLVADVSLRRSEQAMNRAHDVLSCP